MKDPAFAYARLRHKQQLELLEHVEKVERIRRRRDVLMSLAQASATNPQLTNAGIGLAGAAIGTVSMVARKWINAAHPRALGKYALPITPIEIAGDGLAVLAGVKGIVNLVGDLPIPGTSRATSQSIAFDIPDSEGAVILPSQAEAYPFQSRRTAQRGR